MVTTALLFIIYQLLQIIFFPIIILFIIIRNFYRPIIGNFKERCGLVPKIPSDAHTIWIHAVSVGEVLSVQELINTIKKQVPNALCYVTVGTTSGKRIAQANIKADIISFLPYDFLPSIILAYQRIKPKTIIIMEAELWPNLLVIGQLKKIPLILLNARINPRSVQRLKILQIIFKTLCKGFTAIFAQNQSDCERFINLGIEASKIYYLGNLKAFNVVAKKAELINSEEYAFTKPDNMVLLAGSIHPEEDIIYLELFMRFKQVYPNLKLILAPRHFSWQNQLVLHIQETKSTFFIWDDDHHHTTSSTSFNLAFNNVLKHYDIILIGKLGMLFKLYPYADIFFLGGTFVPVGGHNLLESTVWNVPTIIGPYYHNCKDIADRLEKIHGVIKVKDKHNLLTKTEYLLQNIQVRQSIGHTSGTWVNQEAIQVKKNLKVLLKNFL